MVEKIATISNAVSPKSICSICQLWIENSERYYNRFIANGCYSNVHSYPLITILVIKNGTANCAIDIF